MVRALRRFVHRGTSVRGKAPNVANAERIRCTALIRRPSDAVRARKGSSLAEAPREERSLHAPSATFAPLVLLVVPRARFRDARQVSLLPQEVTPVFSATRTISSLTQGQARVRLVRLVHLRQVVRIRWVIQRARSVLREAFAVTVQA